MRYDGDVTCTVMILTQGREHRDYVSTGYTTTSLVNDIVHGQYHQALFIAYGLTCPDCTPDGSILLTV